MYGVTVKRIVDCAGGDRLIVVFGNLVRHKVLHRLVDLLVDDRLIDGIIDQLFEFITLELLIDASLNVGVDLGVEVIQCRLNLFTRHDAGTLAIRRVSHISLLDVKDIVALFILLEFKETVVRDGEVGLTPCLGLQ